MKRKTIIWAIILAAGESKRMNGPKLILPYGDSTIIEHLIGNVLQSEVSGIVLVLGAWQEEIRRATGNLQVRYAINENYKYGMLSSVKCGIKSLPGEAVAAMIIPGDQPGIDTETMNSLILAKEKSDKGILISTFNGKRGHPILADRKYFNNIVKLNDTEGLRGLPALFPDDVLEVETNNELIIKDIDTREDYLKSIGKS